MTEKILSGETLLNEMTGVDMLAYYVIIRLHAVLGGLVKIEDADDSDEYADGRVLLMGCMSDDIGDSVNVHVYKDKDVILRVEHVRHNSYWMAIDKDYNVEIDGDTTLHLIHYILEDLIGRSVYKNNYVAKQSDHEVVIDE